MILDSLIIEGFSNIEHVRLDIGEINALIAPNSYGKRHSVKKDEHRYTQNVNNEKTGI